jgi:DedD protein
VLLLAGAGIAGYLYGLGTAAEKNQRSSTDKEDAPPVSGTASAQSETSVPVTFYSVLTEPRGEVSVPAPEPKQKSSSQREKAEPDRAGGDLSLILQVASYKAQETAKELLEQLSAEGYPGTIQVADLGERGVWYRVRIGPYGTEKKAGEILEKLRKERGLKGYIVR